MVETLTRAKSADSDEERVRLFEIAEEWAARAKQHERRAPAQRPQ